MAKTLSIKIENVANFDTRAKKLVWKHNGKDIFEPKMNKVVITKENTLKNEHISFYEPNNIGILLSIMKKSKEEALKLFAEKIEPCFTVFENEQTLEYYNKNKIVYDFIEKMQTAIVFGYTAIEAFINVSIDDNYIYRKKNSKGIIEEYNKIAIERWLTLEEKTGIILVKIYETTPLKGTTIWNNFKKFEEFRHKIIHQKSIDLSNLYNNYFMKETFSLINTPIEIISFFYENRKNKNLTRVDWPWVEGLENDFPAILED